MFLVIYESGEMTRIPLNRQELILPSFTIEYSPKGHIIHLHDPYTYQKIYTDFYLRPGHYRLSSAKKEDIELYVYDKSGQLSTFHYYRSKISLDWRDLRIPKGFYLKIENSKLYSFNKYIYLNGKPFNNERIKGGDRIDFFAYRLIYYDDFWMLNSQIDRPVYLPDTVSRIEQQTFHRKYRNKPVVKNMEIHLKHKELNRYSNQHIFLNYLPMIFTSLASISAIIINLNSNPSSTNNRSYLSALLLPGAMIVSFMVIQPLIRLHERHVVDKNNQKMVREYQLYLKQISQRIDQFKKEYLQVVEADYVTADHLRKIYENNDLYRNPKNSDDYLLLSMGIGRQRIEGLTIVNENKNQEDKIYQLSENMIQKCRKGWDLPLFMDLKKHKCVSVIMKQEDHYYLEYLLSQIFLLHSPTDLKAVVVADKEYEFIHHLKRVPHLIYEGKRHLYVAKEPEYGNADLVIAINSNDMVTRKEGVYYIFVNDRLEDAHLSSEAVVTYQKGYGRYKDQEKIVDFISYPKVLENYILWDGLTDIGYIATDGYRPIIPFSQMYQDRIRPKEGLCAYLGFDGEKLVTLDLDEKKDGPHGLIVGTTGSGKTELILTMIISLAINYPPDYLQFVIIDFKGGNLINTLSNREYTLPHLINTHTNIDEINFKRILVSFRNECERRQKIFKDALAVKGKTVSDIYKYNEAAKRNEEIRPLAHLVVIIDEFAEIAKTHPEFIDEVISISRVGRSLGVHLILSTQKAGGVISEQIKSNSNFKICLKVNEPIESKEVIGTDDASRITTPGYFYLKSDRGLVKGMSAYANADINKSYMKYVELLDIHLQPVKRIYQQPSSLRITEAEKLVGMLAKGYPDYPKESDSLWKKELRRMTYKETVKQYQVDNGSYIFGLSDDYYHKRYLPVVFKTDENALVISTDHKLKQLHLINSLNSLVQNKAVDIVVLNLLNYDIDDYQDNVEIIGVENKKKLASLLGYLKNKENIPENDLLIIINDLQALYRYDPDYLELFKSLLIASGNSRYKFLIYCGLSSDINYQLSMLIRQKVYLGDNSNKDVDNIFSERFKDNVHTDGLIQDEHLLGFKLFEYKLCKSDHHNRFRMKDIDLNRRMHYQNDRLYMGYTSKLYEDFYLDLNKYPKVLFLSEDQQLLEYLTKSVKDPRISVSDIDELDDIKAIIRYPVIYFGYGLRDRYQLNPKIKDDLNEDEALFIWKQERIRFRYFKGYATG